MDGLPSLGSAPAHIQPGNGLRLNAAAQAGIQASFAVLKIKGKVWRIRFRGEERILKDSAGTGRDGRPLPVEPVSTVDVIVVGASQAISKRFYAGGYVEGAEGTAPDCFSINGITPDPAAAHKQAELCATCPKNIWGSAMMDDGRKTKACNDRRRIAVVPAADPDNLNDGGALLLDIPPSSLKVLDAYARALERQGADMSQVITRIGFNPEKTLELTFSGVGWVTDPRAFDTAIEHGKSDQVKRMLYEELVEVTADVEQPALLGPKPSHMLPSPPMASPASQVMQQPLPPVITGAQPAPVVTQPAAPVAPPAPVAQVAQPAPTPRPAPPPAPTPAPQPLPPAAQVQGVAPTIVQGAPADLQSSIDDIDALLNNC